MLRKVLLLSTSAGAGHIRAAEAVEKAFNKAPDADSREVRHIDVLNYTNKLFRHLYSKAYIDLVNKMPEVPGWFYDKLDKPWKNERRRLARPLPRGRAAAWCLRAHVGMPPRRRPSRRLRPAARR